MGDLPKPPANIDWIKLQNEMNSMHPFESNFQRIIRKCVENPLVPIGTFVTVGALSYGLYNFYLGDRNMQQKMMRLRVGAQLFTIAAAVGGIVYNLPKDKRTFKDFIASGEPKNRNNPQMITSSSK